MLLDTLRRAKARSLTLVTIGHATNLLDLLTAPGGRALVASRVAFGIRYFTSLPGAARPARGGRGHVRQRQRSDKCLCIFLDLARNSIFVIKSYRIILRVYRMFYVSIRMSKQTEPSAVSARLRRLR